MGSFCPIALDGRQGPGYPWGRRSPCGENMQIKSNYKRRPLLGDVDVPKKVLDEYDWLDDDEKTDGWMKYKDQYYHLSDFMWIPADIKDMKGWDGYMSDSFFSGIVIKVFYYTDEYIIGTYM
jgi:hypothetical protein